MKKFDENPALQFITGAAAEEEPITTPAKLHYKPEAEVRNKRVQILLSQATDKAAREAAAERGISLNGLINEAIEAYLKKGAKRK